MSGRTRIALTPEEVGVLLDQERTVICATIGRDGWPHLMPLWYTVRDGEPWAWTYAKSQKVRNLERDPRCTLQIEAGDEYTELHGLMAKAEAIIHRDVETVADFGRELSERYGGEPSLAVVERQAPKRVALQFAIRKIATWDHRKLA